MKFNQLYYFKCVCKHRNITNAARELHISQPAITKAIQELESELGITLLHRTNKNVELTSEGQLFLNKSSAILSDLEALTDEMRDLGHLRRRSLRIGVPPAIGTMVLPQLSIIARRQFGLELEIFDDSSDEVIRGVETDELDLAIALLGSDYYPGIDYRILRQSSLCFCTSRDNPLAKADKIHISQLENERIIYFYPGELIHNLFEKYGITPKYILRSNQMVTICNYITAGMASTMQFPEAFTAYPEICAVPLADPVPLNISILKKRGKHQFAAAQKLYQYLADHPEEIISC